MPHLASTSIPAGACVEVSTLLTGKGSMALPATSSFEPLLPQATNVLLSVACSVVWLGR